MVCSALLYMVSYIAIDMHAYIISSPTLHVCKPIN
jgi:hypothetical protein